MKKTHKNKTITFLVSFVLLMTIAVGGSLAFLITDTAALPNTFIPSKVTTSVEESFENGVKSDVRIKNTGDIPAFIRAAVVITWQDAEGNVCGQLPVAGEDYTIDPTDLPTGWLKDKDNFYYYCTAVPAGEETGELINKIENVNSTVINGTTYYLNVEIIASGIQSEYDGTDAHPATQAWGVTVENGAITAVNNG